jgi:hypothetical protein
MPLLHPIFIIDIEKNQGFEKENLKGMAVAMILIAVV